MDEDDLVALFSEYAVLQKGDNLVLAHICDEQWDFPDYPMEATVLLHRIVTHEEECPK